MLQLPNDAHSGRSGRVQPFLMLFLAVALVTSPPGQPQETCYAGAASPPPDATLPSFTRVTRSRSKTPFCLRQQGASNFICMSFLRSASAKTTYVRKESTAANDHMRAPRNSCHSFVA